MNTINQTDKELKRIEAKQTLGLPLTAHETALLTLYGTTERVRAAGNIADKFNRVKNLAKLPPDRQRVKSESITDTLLDMANYCIMTVIEIENQNKQGGANNE